MITHMTVPRRSSAAGPEKGDGQQRGRPIRGHQHLDLWFIPKSQQTAPRAGGELRFVCFQSILQLSPLGLPGLVCGPSAGAPHILWEPWPRWRTSEAQHSSCAFPRGLFGQKPPSFKPEAPSKAGRSPDKFWAGLLVKLEETGRTGACRDTGLNDGR